MQNHYILWLTGVDSLLKRDGDSPSPHETDETYREICTTVANTISQRHNRATVKYISGGCIVEGGDKRMALISSPGYTPEQMHEDITTHDLTHVVFLRSPRQFTRQRYVEVAADLDFSFFKQQMPDPVLFRGISTAPDPHTPLNFTQNITYNININAPITVNSGTMKGNTINNNSNNNNNSPKKSWKDYAVNLLVSIGANLITNCSFYSALTKL
ncbi:MAG: hypothetical protein K2I64_01215 [Muribaculaceae bacterium]|nr:hypothetical protein [Muribaculaceae bacterium]